MARAKWKLREGITWRQKLEAEHPNHGKVCPIPPRMQKRFGRGTMVIPKPLDVETLIRKVRKGKLATHALIRSALAAQAGADHACPLTTGMFILIVAEAAEESRRNGRKRIVPYWRAIKDNGALNEKFPGGVRAQAAKLRTEGFTISPARGKQPPRVKDFERALMKRLP